MGNDVEIMAKVDAMALGYAVLAALVRVRRGEPYDVKLSSQGTAIYVNVLPAGKFVVVGEVEDA